MHSLHDLVQWSDSSATSDQSDLCLLHSLIVYSPLAVAFVGKLPRFSGHWNEITNFNLIQVLRHLFIRMLLCLLVDFDHEVD